MLQTLRSMCIFIPAIGALLSVFFLCQLQYQTLDVIYMINAFMYEFAF